MQEPKKGRHRRTAVQIRISEGERQLFLEAAELEDAENLSAWCRGVLRKAARKRVSKAAQQ